MLLVVDTNIIVSAIKTSIKYDDIGNPILTKPQKLIRDIFNGEHVLIVSPDIMEEYEDVLNRPQLKLNSILVEKFLAYIKIKAVWIIPRPSDQSYIEMIDETDRVFFDAAKCMNVKLITNNLKHYPVHELRSSIDEIY